MGFYEEISKYYDYIFPAGTEQLDFIKNTAGAPGARILDVACGSGVYSAELAEAGFQVTATDLDENMVEMARDKADRDGTEFSVVQCDMRELANCLDGSFDCVFCIGNSIVHLESKEDIGNAIRQMGALVMQGGAVILQIINYDRILRHGVNELPTIREDSLGLEFVRKYEFVPEKGIIRFNTRLTIGWGEDREEYDNSIELLPLMSGELRKLINEGGFSKVEYFADFQETPYHPDAYMLVVRAVK
jgi:glycine/sarcosine N-methyltransferase